jgi:hypothetical protein
VSDADASRRQAARAAGLAAGLAAPELLGRAAVDGASARVRALRARGVSTLRVAESM